VSWFTDDLRAIAVKEQQKARKDIAKRQHLLNTPKATASLLEDVTAGMMDKEKAELLGPKHGLWVAAKLIGLPDPGLSRKIKRIPVSLELRNVFHAVGWLYLFDNFFVCAKNLLLLFAWILYNMKVFVIQVALVDFIYFLLWFKHTVSTRGGTTVWW
jgi:hypothetical protein